MMTCAVASWRNSLRAEMFSRCTNYIQKWFLGNGVVGFVSIYQYCEQFDARRAAHVVGCSGSHLITLYRFTHSAYK